MKRKREAFVKSFSWFLLIPGLGLILTCQSWSQIMVSGLGCDNIRVGFQGLHFSCGYGQWGVQGSRNPFSCNKTRSKCPSELLKGINGTCTWAIKPPHHHRPQAGWEYLTHQGLTLGVHDHPLVEVAYMFHKVCLTIIHGECGLSEPPRKSPSLNFARER